MRETRDENPFSAAAYTDRMCNRLGLSLLLCFALLPMRVGAEEALAPGDGGSAWLLHLPGIAGKRRVDDAMILGIREGGFSGSADIYDWTGSDPGLGALLAYQRNLAEAKKVAAMITAHVRGQPGLHVIITAHSGGTGIAVWALERLPSDVKIDTLVLLASALSPEYDLTPALSHVRGHCYAFCSENDVLVLGVGTKMFGTIDGKKTEAAGHVGFLLPPSVDARGYDKLTQILYDRTWVQYDNIGDHMGCMLRPFVRKVVAPLIVSRQP